MIMKLSIKVLNTMIINQAFPKLEEPNIEIYQVIDPLGLFKLLILVMIMMMNCFCGMVDRRKAFSPISSRSHCQRSSPSRISDTPRAGSGTDSNILKKRSLCLYLYLFFLYLTHFLTLCNINVLIKNLDSIQIFNIYSVQNCQERREPLLIDDIMVRQLFLVRKPNQEVLS